MNIPDQKELERRLGPPYCFDGSFDSLWAVEMVLLSVRRVPHCADKVQWVAPYLAAIFARAFDEMGLDVARPLPTTIQVSGAVHYELNLHRDLKKLLSPPARFPTFYQTYWLGDHNLGTAYVPWYGLATVFLNHEWARTSHDLIGKQRDRMDLAVPWLTKEWARTLDLPSHLRPLAEEVSRWMVWPPLGYHTNEQGQHNLPRIRAALDDAQPEEARQVLDAFVATQNRFAQRLGAAASMDMAIPPDEHHEAQLYADAIEGMRIDTVPPFINESIRRLLTSAEGEIKGVEHHDYLRALDDPNGQRAVETLQTLVQSHPHLEAYHCALGYRLQQLGQERQALECFERALEINSNYVQVYINRGTMYAQKGDDKNAAQDFYRAREVEPYNVHLRNNLLISYFLNT